MTNRRPGPSLALPAWVSDFFDSSYAQAGMPWSAQTQQSIAHGLMDLMQLSPGDRVLDQCCGEGYLAGGLAKLGLEVYGVDQSPAYIEKARDMAHGDNAIFALADASQWQPPHKVNAAINWHTSLGYGGPEGARLLLQSLRDAVGEHGLWLVELRNAEHYQKHHPVFFTEEVDTEQWGAVTVSRQGHWEGNELVQHWTIHRQGETLWQQADTRCWHPHKKDIEALVVEMGDKVEGVYADIYKTPLTDACVRMVVIARKS